MRIHLALSAAIALALLFGSILLVASFPQYFSTFGIRVSSAVYGMTGGYLGRPLVEVSVGRQMIGWNGNLSINWGGAGTAGLYPEVYFGYDSDFVGVYALKVTNNWDSPIVRIAVYYPTPTNCPPMEPWYTNSCSIRAGWGPVTSWAFVNVHVAPHASAIIYNATQISSADIITFYFADNSTYTVRPSHVPFPLT